MATLTKGKTFANGELVTPQKLHELVDLGTVSGIVNADISASAAIADTKLAQITTANKVAQSAVANLTTDLAGKAAASHTHTIANVTGLQAALDGKQAAGSYAPATGIAPSAITGTAVITTDSRLSDARTPTSHTHDDRYYTETEINTLLAGKQAAGSYAASSHTHTIADTNGLQAALDGKQAAGSYAPATGIAPSAITGTAVITTDSRLSDARTPTAHTHTDFPSDLNINGVTAGSKSLTSNTVFGSEALNLNTTGYNNTAIGRRALSKNIIHDSCTAVGFDALKNSTGIYNTAVGRSSLESNTTGTLNTAIGVNALNAVTSFANATGLGYDAQVSGSNQIRLGNSGVTAVVSQVGSWSDARDKADIRDTVLGLNFIQKLRAVDFKWDYREDYRPQMPVAPDENATAEEKSAYKAAKSKWLEDIKLTNITHDGTHKRTRYHHGLIAQEVQEVIAATGVDFGGFQNHTIAGGDDAMTISYIELIGPLIKAVQELAARVAVLESK